MAAQQRGEVNGNSLAKIYAGGVKVRHRIRFKKEKTRHFKFTGSFPGPLSSWGT